MSRSPHIVPEPVMSLIKTFSDQNFITYICSNHMKLFNDDILSNEKNELEKYIQTLFSSYQKKSSDIVFKEENEYPDLNNVFVVVEDEIDYINAIKEVLWQLNNVPSTAKKILMHIAKINTDGHLELISEKDYPVTNKIFSISCFNDLLKCEKTISKNGKTVYLYKNPTDKRKGFYYKGKLLSLNQLSLINNVPVITIQKRLSRGMKLENAIK